MARDVTTDVIEGLSKIGNIRVLSPPDPPAAGALKVVFTPAVTPDIVVEGRLQKDGDALNLQAHATNTKSGEVRWSTAVSVATENADEALQRSRLAGGLGHDLAAYANSLLYPGERPGAADAQARAKIVVEQATASVAPVVAQATASVAPVVEQAQRMVH